MRSSWLEFLGLLSAVLIFLGAVIAALVYIPETPLPDRWNPIKPLNVTAEFTPVAHWKLRQREGIYSYCQAYLTDLGVEFLPLPAREDSEDCHIRNQVEVQKLTQARINPLRSTCHIALRLALWEKHQLQPIAQEKFGQSVRAMTHIGSYSCRLIRNSDGQSNHYSEHATANAVDISELTLSDGTALSLKANWEDETDLLKRARDGACPFFNVVLSPDYNVLHEDHFHFDMGRSRVCR